MTIKTLFIATEDQKFIDNMIFRSKQIILVALLLMLLMTAAVLVPHVPLFVTVPLVLIGTLLIPGTLLIISLNIKLHAISEYILSAIPIGLCFLLVWGLGINWLLPIIGIANPLSTIPLVFSFDIAMVILALYGYFYRKNFSLVCGKIKINRISLIFGMIPLLFLATSILGVGVLNNFGPGTITLVMLCSIAIYVIALIWRHASIQEWVYVVALYLIGLSLLLMYALRGAHILGWDINQEYQVFQMTLSHHLWKMSYYPGLSYNACVSITILPTIFTELVHVHTEYVFKVLFQILFAVTPVMLYFFAKRYMNAALSFLASFLFLSQTWFFEQMPALIRQEVAFIFYLGLLLALFNVGISKRTRYLIFSLCTIGLVLSHYSTAYICLALLCGTFILSSCIQFFYKPLRHRTAVLVPVMLLVPLLSVLLWQGIATHTSRGLVKFTTNDNGIPVTVVTTEDSGLDKEMQTTGSSPQINMQQQIPVKSTRTLFLRDFFFNTDQNTELNILEAHHALIGIYRIKGDYQVYSDAEVSGYVPTVLDENNKVPSRLPDTIVFLLEIFERAGKVLVIVVFPLIGIAGLYLAVRRNPAKGDFDFLMISVVAYLLLASAVLIPYVGEYYNVTRLYLQMIPMISVATILGGVALMRRFMKHQVRILGIIAALLFCSLTGVFDQFTGGNPRITLNQPPSTLDEFYIHDSEIAGAQWLSRKRNADDMVQADVISNLRLESFGNMDSNNTAIFPETIAKDGYVYLTAMNLEREKAFVLYKNNLLEYRYPLTFLRNSKNLIYSSGGSEIYR
jgi:uncharacterized membrane protein